MNRPRHVMALKALVDDGRGWDDGLVVPAPSDRPSAGSDEPAGPTRATRWWRSSTMPARCRPPRPGARCGPPTSCTGRSSSRCSTARTGWWCTSGRTGRTSGRPAGTWRSAASSMRARAGSGAAGRELAEEAGVEAPLEHLGPGRYEDGAVRELAEVFLARSAGPVHVPRRRGGGVRSHRARRRRPVAVDARGRPRQRRHRHAPAPRTARVLIAGHGLGQTGGVGDRR